MDFLTINWKPVKNRRIYQNIMQKHTKYIVVTGYKRIYLSNEASWRRENCIRILGKYSSFLSRDGFSYNQLETSEKSTNLSEYHAKTYKIHRSDRI